MKIDQSSFTLLDGPLLPNDALEGARAIRLDAPDDLAVLADGSLAVSDGNAVLRIETDAKDAKTFALFDNKVTALCQGDGETIHAAVEGLGIYTLSSSGEAVLLSTAAELTEAITACCPAVGGGVLVVRATTTPGLYPYTHELFSVRGSGQLLKVAPDGSCTVLAEGLRGPHGVTQSASGEIVVADSWEAAVRVLEPSGGQRTVLAQFAGYPGRLSPLTSGGYLMTCLSRRDPLIDFIRTEKAFAERMMREIDPKYWVAPRLESAIDVHVPAQSGATRLFGEVKPWAPSLSYGLVVEADAGFVPLASHHSRANGVRHGIVSAVEWNGKIAAVSKATGEVLFMGKRLRSNDR